MKSVRIPYHRPERIRDAAAGVAKGGRTTITWFKRGLVGVALIALTLHFGAQRAAGQYPASGRVKLFLGPVPNEDGFTAPLTKELSDSYRDLRSEYAKKSEFQFEIELVDRLEEASLALELTGRGLRDTGERIQSPGYIVRRKRKEDIVVPGNITPVTEKTLSAQLVVLDRDYAIALEGRARKDTYRKQAKDLLQQVTDWVRQNRNRLP